MKNIFQILILTATFSIVACGKNVTNTNSDPLRGYDNLGNDVALNKRIANKTLPASEDDGDVIGCPKPYSLSFTTKDGKDLKRALPFVVGQKDTVLINISSNQFPNLTINTFGKPDNASIEQVKGGYALTFQPRADQVNMAQQMAITVNVPQTGCFKGHPPEPFKVTVTSGKLRPEISRVTLNQETPIESTAIVSFTVDVTDPNLSNNERPQKPQFVATTKFPTDELLPIDTKDAFDCPTSSKISASIERFNCTLDLNKSKLMPSNRKDKSIATGGFSIIAESVNHEQSIEKPIMLNLHFPETPAQSAQPVPSVPKDAPKVTPKPSKTKTASVKPGAKT